MGKDYYASLGLTKSATTEDIKKAYKKLALKWHPDRNKDSKDANTKFREINEAYEVLSDENKKVIYDKYGEEGLKGQPAPEQFSSQPNGSAGFSGFPGGGFPGGASFSFSSSGPGGRSHGFQPSNANDIFMQFFGGQNPFGQMGGMSGFGGDDMDFEPAAQPRQRKKIPAVQVELGLTLQELCAGATKKLKITRKRNNVNDEKTIEIQVKPGWKEGTKITFSGEGDEVQPGVYQDMIFIVKEKPDPNFKRNQDNIETGVQLTLNEALNGFKKNIPTPSGKLIPLSVNGITQPEQTKVISGEGLPNSKSGRKGDLVITFHVTFSNSDKSKYKN